MRQAFYGTLIILATTVSISAPAWALSVLQGNEGTPPHQATTVVETPNNGDSYIDKPSLSAVTEAMRLNREHRRMFADLTKGSGRIDNALTKYIKALDARYAILASVGDSLVKATTEAEVIEASAIAIAVLGVRTDLDRAIGATQMAIIDAARLEKSYFGACNAHGVLADGTKCVKVTDGDGTQQFWAQPWDAGRFPHVLAKDSDLSP
jgi:hypothetical protein